MSAQAMAGPVVREGEIEFSFAHGGGSLVGVALAHELRRPRLVPFARRTRHAP
jgi:hypothetical protein